MDPAFGSNEPGDHLLIGINRDRGFQEMLSNLAGSDRVIVAGISAGKPGWIDCCDGYWIIVGIKQIQCFPKRVAQVQGFYPAEEFLKRRKMRYGWKVQFFLDWFHVSNIFNKIPVVLVPVVLEEYQDQKLILGVDLFRIFTGIGGNPYCFHDRKRGSDKPDIPARQSFSCLLAFWAHTLVRRQCTLDLSVVSTFCFKKWFLQSKKMDRKPDR